ncbi:MAG: hypothetical protein Kow0074_13500 [Candidatus Zixiibacteriota bacterium]
MGGWNYLDVEAETAGIADESLQRAVDAIRRVDQTYSVFSPQTALGRLNASGQRVAPVDDPQMIRAIQRSLDLAGQTGGAFDPTVESLMREFGFRSHGPAPRLNLPTLPRHQSIECDLRGGTVYREDPRLALDSGGWAKGMAADLAAEAALECGATVAQVNCGYDIVRRGRGHWECLIRHPYGAVTDIAVRCRHRYPAVATSANTETMRRRPDGTLYGHLMDPRTAQPAVSDLASATVFAADGFRADAFASALFVMGKDDASSWLRAHDDVGAVLIPRGWNNDVNQLLVFGDVECLRTRGF